jgi:hypothetical protein
MSEMTERYLPVLTAFVGGEMSASDFQQHFLALWREDRDAGRPTGSVLDDLMIGVDCYDENPDLIGRIDSSQLREETRDALARLGHA